MLNELGWIRAAGAPQEVGRALGRAGQAAVREHLLPSAIWAEITSARHTDAVARMSTNTQIRFPAIWAEMEGLAEGLGLPLRDVMAWNCRGELLASTSDGCTTVQLPGEPAVIGHNEDGLPFFRGACFIAEVEPDAEPGFLSFCYPGSIPGHAFAVTRTGLAQSVNNMRLLGIRSEMPRMVLGRAVLAVGNIDAAVGILGVTPPSSGFHFTLAQAGSSRIIGVEFGDGGVSVQEISAPSIHANHALHLPLGEAGQMVTKSSRDRQARGEALLAAGERDPLAILRDMGGPGLPIWRSDANDPDDENTLATIVLHVGAAGLDWEILASTGAEPVYEGRGGCV